MQLLDDLIDLLSSESATTESALIKAQVLAHRLGNGELAQWVEHELRGYPADAEIPSYRVVTVTLIGHITNGVYHHSNQTLPIVHLPEKLQKNLTSRELRPSISVLEEWAKTENMGTAIPTEILPAFSQPSPRRTLYNKLGADSELDQFFKFSRKLDLGCLNSA